MKSKRRATGPIYLGDIDVCGIPFAIFEASPVEDPRLEDCYGYTSGLGYKIVLRNDMPAECFRHTLIHEIQHAIWEHSGIRPFVQNQVTNAAAFEETLIEMQTAHLIRALSSVKGLRSK